MNEEAAVRYAMFGYFIFNFVANRSADATMEKKKKTPQNSGEIKL